MSREFHRSCHRTRNERNRSAQSIRKVSAYRTRHISNSVLNLCERANTLKLYQATNLESQHIGPRHLCLLRHSSSSGKLKGTRTDQKSKTLQVTEHFALALLSLNITLPLVSLSTLPPRYSTLTNFSSHNRIAQVRSITMSEPLTIGDLLKKPCKAQEKSDGSEWLYSMEA
jgi:hypothetical protein